MSDEELKKAMRAAYFKALRTGSCDYWQRVLDVVRTESVNR